MKRSLEVAGADDEVNIKLFWQRQIGLQKLSSSETAINSLIASPLPRHLLFQLAGSDLKCMGLRSVLDK